MRERKEMGAGGRKEGRKSKVMGGKGKMRDREEMEVGWGEKGRKKIG